MNIISQHVKNKPVTAIRPSREISKHVMGAVWLWWDCCDAFRLLLTGLMLPLVGPIASSRRKLQNVMRLPPEIYPHHLLWTSGCTYTYISVSVILPHTVSWACSALLKRTSDKNSKLLAKFDITTVHILTKTY